jgi:RHS repeat-associated protein
VLAAIPLLYKLTKSDRLGKFQPTALPDNSLSGLGKGDFVTETIGAAYLLVELLDEKGDFIREVNKFYVTSQGVFGRIGSQDNEAIDFGDECQTSGFLRFSLVNENETQPAYFDDFEITHKANPQKLTVSSWAEYYAFGKVAKASCPANGAYRYGYQGEFAEKDGETEWNSFELRQYDSEIGRWLSTDPYGRLFRIYPIFPPVFMLFGGGFSVVF